MEVTGRVVRHGVEVGANLPHPKVTVIGNLHVVRTVEVVGNVPITEYPGHTGGLNTYHDVETRYVRIDVNDGRGLVVKVGVVGLKP